MINRVLLIGNLTRDTETSVGASTTMARMRIATNSTWRDAEGNRQEASEFHSVVAFGRLAEVCSAYCTRGRRVYVEGRLRTRDYEGSDGLRRFTTEVVADQLRLLDRVPGDGAQPEADPTAATAVERDTGAGTPSEPAPVAVLPA